MLVSKIDYNMLSEIMAMKEVIRGSVEAVLDEKITASHLATDVYRLLDLLDKLENDWKGTPPEADTAMAAAQVPPVAQQVPVEQPPVAEVKVEVPPTEQVQVEAPPTEQVQAEVPPVEQTQPEAPPTEQVQPEAPPTEQAPVELPPTEDEL